MSEKVKTLRTVASTQIAAYGSTLNAAQTGFEMTLRPDLGGVEVVGQVGAATRRFLVPFGIIAHVELECAPAAAKPALPPVKVEVEPAAKQTFKR